MRLHTELCRPSRPVSRPGFELELWSGGGQPDCTRCVHLCTVHILYKIRIRLRKSPYNEVLGKLLGQTWLNNPQGRLRSTNASIYNSIASTSHGRFILAVARGSDRKPVRLQTLADFKFPTGARQFQQWMAHSSAAQGCLMSCCSGPGSAD